MELMAQWLHGLRNEEWLRDRRQRVVLNGTASSWMEVSSGVPQGSVLGPILFVIFIDDIDDIVDAAGLFLSKFADDTKGAKVIKDQSSATELQQALDNLFTCSQEWKMNLNVEKYHIIHLVRRSLPKRQLATGPVNEGGVRP